MKFRQFFFVYSCSLVFIVCLCRAESFTIKSFDHTGHLSFEGMSNATSYRVEWAGAPTGPWTNFSAAAAGLDLIWASGGTGIVTVTVPMCYRVVADVVITPPQMVLLRAGTNLWTHPDYGQYTYVMPASIFIETHEVTKALWDDVYNWAVTNGYSFEHAGTAKGTTHPVVGISWYDVVKWCNARSQKEGLLPAYYLNPSNTVIFKTGTTNTLAISVNYSDGYRLPTREESDYASTGGSGSGRYPWGDTINHSYANYYGQSRPYSYDTGYAGNDTNYMVGAPPYTSPVGSFPANGYGLYDMVGNVREFCWLSIYNPGNMTVNDAGYSDSAEQAQICFSMEGEQGASLMAGFRCVLPPRPSD